MLDDECDVRMECLRLALQTEGDPRRAIEGARLYADFVLGTSGAEVIRAARDLASTVTSAEA